MTQGSCPLCAGPVEDFEPGRVLGHDVTYVRCRECRSVALLEPHWLEQAYSSAISALDVGLLERCLQLANVTHALLAAQRPGRGPFLDFAGGYGTLTRLMRDRGRDFRHHDPLCENVFARGWEGGLDARYAAVTAYEVLEHLVDPAAELAPVAACTDLLLFTTEVVADPAPAPGAWAYYAPESGQHITFSTVAGLRALGARLGYELTTSGRLVHAFHRGPLRASTRALLADPRRAYLVGAVASEVGRRRGLTLSDSNAAAQRLEGRHG